MGKSCALGLRRAPVHERHELVVDALAHHGDEFLGHRVGDAILSDEGRRVLGAPPVEVVAARPPVISVPLRDAGDDVAVVFDFVVTT